MGGRSLVHAKWCIYLPTCILPGNPAGSLVASIHPLPTALRSARATTHPARPSLPPPPASLPLAAPRICPPAVISHGPIPNPPSLPQPLPTCPPAVVSYVVFPVRARALLKKKMARTLIKIGDLAVWLLGQVCVVPQPSPPGGRASLPGATDTDDSRYMGGWEASMCGGGLRGRHLCMHRWCGEGMMGSTSDLQCNGTDLLTWVDQLSVSHIAGTSSSCIRRAGGPPLAGCQAGQARAGQAALISTRLL